MSSNLGYLQRDIDAAINNLQRDIDAAIKKLQQFGHTLDIDARRAIAEDAAVLLIDEIAQRAPMSKKAHRRYSTPKFSRKIRAPKGKGRVEATYLPGNLKGAIKMFKYSRSPNVIVGPRYRKKDASGVFGKGGRYDAYYAHMVEYGTMHSRERPFVRPAVAAVGAKVKKRMLDLLERKINDFARKNAV